MTTSVLTHLFYYVYPPLAIKVIISRIARFLEHRGLLQRDTKNSYLELDSDLEDPMN
jgi:hypothetical protein